MRNAGASAAFARLVPAAVVMTAMAVMVWWTWGTWPDPIVDFGRELYLAWQLSIGKTLYVDVESFNGPLSPYLNSLWFRLGGVSLRTLMLANLAIAGVLTWLIFRLFRRLADLVTATVCCLTFLGLFAFGQLLDIGNYNFVTPYSHELTHGVVLSFAAIAAIDCYANSGLRRWVWIASLLIGLVCLTKAEVFAAILPAGIAGLWIADGRNPDRRSVTSLIAIAGFALPVAAAAIALGTAMPARDALRGVTGSLVYVFNDNLRRSDFYQRVAGTGDVTRSMRIILEALAVHVCLFGAATTVALTWRRSRQLLWPVVSGAIVITLPVIGLFVGNVDQFVRPLPLLLLALLVILVRQAGGVAPQHDRRAFVLPLTLTLFGLLLLAKIGLNVHVHSYGFALAMPGTLLFVAMVFYWIPNWVQRKGGNGKLVRAVAFGAWVGVMALYLGVASHYRALHRHTVGEGADAFRADSRGAIIANVLADLRPRLRPGDTLAVLPEGAMLNFLLRSRTPSPFVNFLPPEYEMFGEARISSSLMQDPPTFIVLIDRPTEEYGSRFDTGYGKAIFEWTLRHYESVKDFAGPPTEDRWGAKLMRRSSSAR